MSSNPYQAPQALLDEPKEPAEIVLATRIDRFLAHLVDTILFLVALLVFSFASGAFDQGWFLRWYGSLIAAAVGFVSYVLFHGYLLHTHGQTIGKLLLKIRIVDQYDETPMVHHLLLLRYLPTQLIGGLLPFVHLIDCMMIFGSARRCLHDRIAGTKVIKA